MLTRESRTAIRPAQEWDSNRFGRIENVRTNWLTTVTAMLVAGTSGMSFAQSPPAATDGDTRMPPAAASSADEPERVPLAARRIVKAFDFDERRLGNVETVPMFWNRHVADGFPLFLEGRFDSAVGHLAPPSFRLDLNGGSIAYRYDGRDIAVRTQCDYLVVAYARAEGLQTARMFLTACLLDRGGDLIPGTQQRSNLLAATPNDQPWQPLSVRIRCQDPEARYLGVSVWLAQKQVWNPSAPRLRAIEREDVRATAWVDDLVVYRMPRVSLQTSHPGGVFGEHEPVDIFAEISDPDGLNLAGQITVRSADGKLTRALPVPVQTQDRPTSEAISLRDLPIGLYEVELAVTTQETTLVRRHLRFARVSGRFSPPTVTGRGFGVALRDIDLAALPGQHELLRDLRTQLVKVPVWYAQQAISGELNIGPAVDACLEAVRQTHADPIGVMRDDRADVRPADRGMISMIEMLNEDPLAWKHLIAAIWARYAGLIHVWQLGDDGNPDVFLDDRLPTLIPRLRHEMADLMAEPLLASTLSAFYSPPAGDTGDYRAVFLPCNIRPDDIGEHLRAHLGQDRDRAWITVEPLPEGACPREMRLADLGRRLIEAAYAGTGGVFMDAPWDVHLDATGGQVDPREDLLVLRTVSDVLGEAEPISRTTLDGQVRCTVFDRNGLAILCLWNDYAPPQGREHRLLLGDQPELVDLWGRRSSLPVAGRDHLVRVGPTPVFVLNTLTWLVEFRRQFEVTPAVLQASFDNLGMQVSFRNTYPDPISGIVRLLLPDGWDIRPNRLPFSLRPGEQFKQNVEVRFPLNAQAQVMPLLGEFTIDANRRYLLTTPAWFEFGLEGINVTAVAYRHADRVTVRLTLANRTDQTLHFEGSLIAPARQRQERLFANLLPGQSLTRTFEIPDAADLVARQVRVSLKEIRGSRMWNRLIAVP